MNTSALASYAARLHALGLQQQPLAKGQVVTGGNQAVARFKDEGDAEFFVAAVAHLASPPPVAPAAAPLSEDDPRLYRTRVPLTTIQRLASRGVEIGVTPTYDRPLRCTSCDLVTTEDAAPLFARRADPHAGCVGTLVCAEEPSASLARGIADADRGDLHDLGSFAAPAEEAASAPPERSDES